MFFVSFFGKKQFFFVLERERLYRALAMILRASCSLGASLVGMGAVRGVRTLLTGWACRAGSAAHQPSALFGDANRRLLSGGGGRGGGGTGGGVDSDVNKNMPQKLNIELNQRILSIDSMQELCDLIHASSAQFDHENVATAFRQVLLISHPDDSPDSVAKALRTLAKQLSIIDCS